MNLIFDVENPATLFSELKGKIITRDQDKDMVHDLLSTRNRLYHGVWHIASMYSIHQQLCKLYAPDLLDDNRILHAIFYHDAIYDTDRPAGALSNEVASADLFSEHFSNFKIGPSDLGFETPVRRMILATENHFEYREHDRVTEWFIGLDLASLAFPRELFNLNSQLIRLEYAHISDADWVRGRSTFLKSFVERELPAFRDPIMFEQFEHLAQENALATLSEWQDSPEQERPKIAGG